MNNTEDKTDDGKETSAAAFARSRGGAGHTLNHGQVGLTKKEYAAIHLRIPESGVDWLDRMIAKAEKRDLAVKFLQGDLANPNTAFISDRRAAEINLAAADSMIAEITKEK